MDYDVFAMSIEADRNGNDQTIPYCDKMTNIVEVNFGSFHIILVGALWYRSKLSDRNVTIIMDECGFFRVNTTHHQPKNRVDSDVWIYPHQVDQCLYMDLPHMHPWEIIVPINPHRQRHLH